MLKATDGCYTVQSNVQYVFMHVCIINKQTNIIYVLYVCLYVDSKKCWGKTQRWVNETVGLN